MSAITDPHSLYEPAAGESGASWRGPVTANFQTINDRINELGVNVLADKYNAPANGVDDDTGAFHDARDDTPRGGILIVPPRHYKVSSLDFLNDVTVQGGGWWNNANVSFGSGFWAGSQYGTWFGGTVIECTATSGRGVLANTNTKVNIRDLMLLGPGSGTSNGFEIGSVSIPYQGVLSNLLAANFGGAAYRGRFWMSTAAYSIESRGCAAGISMSDVSNNVSLYEPKVQFATAGGIVIATNTAMNNIYGGLMQNNTGTSISVAGDNHHVDGVYFENSGATWAVNLASGSHHTVEKCWVSTAGDNMITNGIGTRFTNIFGGGVWDLEVGASANYTILTLCAPNGSYTNNGANTWRILTNAATIGPSTPPVVSGSRGGNAALASALTQLAALGLITDSSS